MRLLEANEELTVSVTRNELRLLASSIGEALEAVETWEFSTRLGAEPIEACALRSEINDVLSQAFRPE